MADTVIGRTRQEYERGRQAARLKLSSLDILGITTENGWEPRGWYGGQAICWQQAVRLCGYMDEVLGVDRSIELDKRTSSEDEWVRLTSGKIPPVAIWNKGQARRYYEATEADRVGWNQYAQAAADAVNNSGKLDSYDSTSTITGYDREAGKVTPWAPPLTFSEWQAKEKAHA